MKCDYCNGEDHLVTACGKRKGERTFTVAGGCFLMAILSPFLILGTVVGAISSAFAEGYQFTAKTWQKSMARMKERQDDEPSV